MEIIENIINLYYNFRTWVLIISYILSAIIIIVGLILFIFKYKYYYMRYIINKLTYNGIYSAVIVVIGELLCLIGLDIKIEYTNFNAALFIIVTSGIIIYGIILCLMFKEILLPMQQICKYIQYITFLELFLLAITQHLEIWEWITGTLGIISIEMLIMLFEKIMDSIQKEKGKETDYPDPDLYPTRKKQLEKFITVLKQQEQEPYAIMVSGEWGAGKSSFIQALEKTLYKNSFIWVYAGSEKTVSEIMMEISAKIIEVLKKNNIFIENKDLIIKYFLAFSDLTEDTTLKSLKKISNILMRDKSINDREYLNRKLNDLKYPIYLIIDDLDRCDNEYQEKMFKVIRESMWLQNCKTIFLVDKNNFLKDKYDTTYIEKYVNFTLDLCEVNYAEIVDYLIDYIWDEYFICSINDNVLKNRNFDQIKKMIYRFPINILEKIEIEMSKNINFEKREMLQQELLKLKKNIIISRKVKNYLKGIKKDVTILNRSKNYGRKGAEDEDWFKAIIEVQFVKNFMPEIYADIKMGNQVLKFVEKYQYHGMNIIFDLNYDSEIQVQKKESMLNYLIYQIDENDFLIKTEKEKYLPELRSNNYLVSHMEKYIICAETYNDLDKILYIYSSEECYNNKLKNTMILMLGFISSFLSPIETNTIEFFYFSKRFKNCLLEKGLTDMEKKLFINEAKNLINRIITENLGLFKNILSIIFSNVSVKIIWPTNNDTVITDLYNIIGKIDERSTFKELTDEKNKLLRIIAYYKDLEIQFKNIKYNDKKNYLEKNFSDINIILEICGFWGNIEYMLDTSKNDKILLSFKKYFILNDKYTYRNEVFDNVSNLIEALNALYNFYLHKKLNYELSDSDYSLFLLNILYRIDLKDNNKLAWYGEKVKDIIKLLNKIAALLYEPATALNYHDHDNDIISRIKKNMLLLDLSFRHINNNNE